jgi:hypothetical protein
MPNLRGVIWTFSFIKINKLDLTNKIISVGNEISFA